MNERFTFYSKVIFEVRNQKSKEITNMTFYSVKILDI